MCGVRLFCIRNGSRRASHRQCYHQNLACGLRTTFSNAVGRFDRGEWPTYCPRILPKYSTATQLAIRHYAPLYIGPTCNSIVITSSPSLKVPNAPRWVFFELWPIGHWTIRLQCQLTSRFSLESMMFSLKSQPTKLISRKETAVYSEHSLRTTTRQFGRTIINSHKL